MRRSRFTITYSPDDSNEILRTVVLAYSADSIRMRYSIPGATILGIERGDYRAKARAAAVHAAGGFTVNRQAVDDAAALLGLKLPVRIRFNSRVGRTNGNYRFKGDHHDIMLKSYRTPEQASDTLWHELTHALQAERDGRADEAVWADVRRSQAHYSYLIRPIEVEARKMSALMKDCPLCS